MTAIISHLVSSSIRPHHIKVDSKLTIALLYEVISNRSRHAIIGIELLIEVIVEHSLGIRSDKVVIGKLHQDYQPLLLADDRFAGFAEASGTGGCSGSPARSSLGRTRLPYLCHLVATYLTKSTLIVTRIGITLLVGKVTIVLVATMGQYQLFAVFMAYGYFARIGRVSQRGHPAYHKTYKYNKYSSSHRLTI